MCITKLINTSPRTSTDCFTDSLPGRGANQEAMINEANRVGGTLASTSIMANLESFRRVHRQNGTDFLSYYQQTGNLSIERELALSTLVTYLAASGQ